MRAIFKIIFSAFVFILFSCKKDHSVLGVDVQPQQDNVNAEYISGLSVTGHTLPYDSVATFNDKSKFIGSNEDPLFGRTDYGIYVTPNTSGTARDFGVNSRISSAEIVLEVAALEYAGDKSASLTYSVFAVKDVLLSTKVYYTKDFRHHEILPICVHTTSFSVSSNGKAVIRIKMDSVYAESLLHDTPNLTSNEVFQAKYKGYYIAAGLQGSGEGVVYKADLDSELSGLILHYKTNASDTITDFRFSFAGARYNTLKYSPKQVIKDQFQDSTLGGGNLYLKGMGMTKLKVQIPFLKNYSDSFKVAVNRAEVIFYVDPTLFSGSGNYLKPPKLVLLSMDSLSRETYAQDLLGSVDYARYDGKYDDVNKRYVFNIAREAQLIFSGKKLNRGFYLVVANADFSLTTIYVGNSKELAPMRRDNYYERVVLAGSNNAQYKPVLNLSYIRFKNEK